MRDDAFGAAIIKRSKPVFKDAKIVVDDVTSRPRTIYSFALKVTYIGKTAKTELREYLWGDNKKLNPEILKGAKFESVEKETDFKIPDAILEEIRKKARVEEQEFHKELSIERKKIIEHLKALELEKENEGKTEEAQRIREEWQRREKAPLPELRVKVEPVALLEIDAPLEIHRTVLENQFTRKEFVWKFDNLTGECDLKCDGCGKKSDEYFLTVDGLACKDCINLCKECSKPMINAVRCVVCEEPLCDEHVHHCSVCHAPLCKEHTTKCEFCNSEMCPEHVQRCSVCNAPLCNEHTFKCTVCGATIGPRHARICDVCGKDVCPEHIHRCEICKKQVCENCAVEIDGKWYCKEHLEKSYGGKWVIPETRCKVCNVALSDEEINRCSVCNAPLCDEHVQHCSICHAPLCDEHVQHCSICHAPLCDEHAFNSELTGKIYCEEHVTVCPECGRTVGINELHGQVCAGCSEKTVISRKSVPREIFLKYPYAKRGKEWFISRGKNTAYITRIKNLTLAYRIVNGEIKEYRKKL